ncbi:hypothetical protein WFJ45_24455, partial [Salmonella enterica subsp. enterica serovar Minnesota]|uniref:hypothetical protein n=1 Tax=Salmonella enterica TaxID=28901 RepID=UPI003D2C9C4B
PNVKAPAVSTPGTHPAVFGLGIVALIVAAGASAVMALEHLAGFTLPGCGAGSPCAALANSRWGKVPGLDWPVSY